MVYYICHRMYKPVRNLVTAVVPQSHLHTYSTQDSCTLIIIILATTEKYYFSSPVELMIMLLMIIGLYAPPK